MSDIELKNKRQLLEMIVICYKRLEKLEPDIEWCWASMEDIQGTLDFLEEDDE